MKRILALALALVMLCSIGIGLCILSILDPMVFDKIPYLSSNFGAAMMFGFIGGFIITWIHYMRGAWQNKGLIGQPKPVSAPV